MDWNVIIGMVVFLICIFIFSWFMIKENIKHEEHIATALSKSTTTEEDALASLTIRDRLQGSDDCIIREISLHSKGKDLAESISGIKQLKELSKKND